MSFLSINELEKLDFTDCQITDINLTDNLELTLEALIICARNSQNANYTDSYADEAKMVFKNVNIEAVTEEGYRSFDADGNLMSEVLDKPIAKEDIKSVISSLKNGYMFNVSCEEKKDDKLTYIIEVDIDESNDNGVIDPTLPTYEIKLSFSQVSVTWERYLNRVQR